MTASNACVSFTSLQQPYAKISTLCAPGWHRRPLPAVAVPFNSEPGKRLFREALLSDGLHGYFSLAETFHTQAEPSYCGPGTLSMVLNSLNIDPGAIWKGNWRYFDEQTLQTCDKRKPKDNPLEHVLEQGITFEEFLYLAECNGASVIPFLASNCTLAHFRSAILAACTRRLDDIRLVCSYNRSTLQQTGAGHFSPIAGYHARDDRVLILDVARFKYPSHWISVELLWQSMCTIDTTTGKSRGFYLITKWPRDSSVQCGASHCQDDSGQTPAIINLLCSPEESLSLFIDEQFRSTIDSTSSAESIVVAVLQSLSPMVARLTTKWTFDIMQKYRLDAVSKSACAQECQCVNLFEFYPSFLPKAVINDSKKDDAECRKPCARVTRSHVHMYAIPTRCALEPFVQLFERTNNGKLYKKLEEMSIEQYCVITKGEPIHLFGGLSSMIDDDEATSRIERGLMTVFLYALRTETFLSSVELFDSSDVSAELKDEIDYAKACFGL